MMDDRGGLFVRMHFFVVVVIGAEGEYGTQTQTEDET